MARLRTHYYAGNARFEQSLDVYTPAYPEAAGCEPLPLVVLVIGSAWCGHRHFIYGGTSWWNSAGPKTVASLGAVCVCIRHRGAFPPPPTSLLGALLVACLLAPLLPQHPLLLLGALLLLAWHPLARGAATHEQMIDDVASALLWVRAHRTELVAAPGAAPPAKMVFGGYSSGAHVAMCLLQRPDLLAARGLPPPAELCATACSSYLASSALASRVVPPPRRRVRRRSPTASLGWCSARRPPRHCHPPCTPSRPRRRCRTCSCAASTSSSACPCSRRA
jgi:hypothetical protein